MGQRLRVTFSRGEAMKYLSHLELMRMWERVFRRAGWHLAYSQGFNPHPRFSFAVPLPVGVAGEAELLELYLDEARPLDEAAEQLRGQLPKGAGVVRVDEVPDTAPSMQRQLVGAEYVATCPPLSSVEALRGETARMMGASALPRQRIKEGKARSYDLRPMIHSLEVQCADERPAVVKMDLRTDAAGAGRPDEVLRELGIEPAECHITRTRLIFRD
ncbi:MAG TPA: TIGR03936 family radical SAM-associated protein [Chloroflexota bacterium]|nr:TIGR03936 family radical SAM-associated protein [Chloroflexota bacterium]